MKYIEAEKATGRWAIAPVICNFIQAVQKSPDGKLFFTLNFSAN